MRKWDAILRYAFSEFLIFQLFFTVAYVSYNYRYGWINIEKFILFKVLFYVLSIGYYYVKRKEKFYFFHNLGTNKRTLLIIVLILDSLLSGSIVYIVNLYRF